MGDFEVLDIDLARAVTQSYLQTLSPRKRWRSTLSYYWSHLIVEGLVNMRVPSPGAFKDDFAATIDAIATSLDLGHRRLAALPAATRSAFDIPSANKVDPVLQRLDTIEQQIALTQRVANLAEELNQFKVSTGETLAPLNLQHHPCIAKGLALRSRELMTFDFRRILYPIQELYSGIYCFDFEDDSYENSPLEEVCGDFASPNQLNATENPERVLKWVHTMYSASQRLDQPGYVCYVIVHSLTGRLHNGAIAYLSHPLVQAQGPELKRNWLLALIVEHFHRDFWIYENDALDNFDRVRKSKHMRMSVFLQQLLHAYNDAHLIPVADDFLNKVVRRKFLKSLSPADKGWLNLNIPITALRHYSTLTKELERFRF